MIERNQVFINGKWVDSSGDGTISVINPATEEAIATVPAGVFNLVSGTGPVVGEAIAGHPLVDLVSLTGSVRAGRRIVELSAGTIKKLALELGGKSAGIVFEDADFERAVPEAIEDAFRNSGQVCGGVTRVLVPRARCRIPG